MALCTCLRGIVCLAILRTSLATTHDCKTNSRFGKHCSNTISLQDNLEAELVCVRNPPLGSKVLLSGKILRLFDREVFKVQGERLSDVKIHTASEDTWLVGLTGITTSETAEEQVRTHFRANSSAVEDSLLRLKTSLQGIWGADARHSYTVAVSPFGSTCIGLKAYPTSGVQGVITVEVHREGPQSKSLWSAGGQGGDDIKHSLASAITLYLGPVLLLCGIVLFAYSETLASSVVFHYASCVSLFTLLSVMLILAIVFWRTGTRGRVAAVAMMATIGVTLTALRDAAIQYCREHWPYALGGLGILALVGFAMTYWRLKGGRPEPYETHLLVFFLRLIALTLMYWCSHSLRVSVTLLLGAVLFYGRSGSAPLQRSLRMVRNSTDALAGPAGAPSRYVDDNGRQRKWAPPTATGRFMTAAEYEMQGQIETDRGLDKLFASPEYKRWLKNNHHRIALAPSADAQASDDVDDEDD